MTATAPKSSQYYSPAAGKAGAAPETPHERERECVPCEIPPFCRNHYFTGKLLTAQDFTAEQRYLRDKLRLHHRALHGWGVVCGLRVKPHPYCPDQRLVIEPGVAIDPCGYEIVVPTETYVVLPKPQPCPPGQQGGYRSGGPETTQQYPSSGPQSDYRPGGPESTAQHPPTDQQGSYRPDEKEKPGQYRPTDPGQQDAGYGGAPAPQPCRPREPEIPLSICLRYVECETDFMPAPFDECGCNSPGGQQPSRICERYTLEVEYEEPPRIEPCVGGDCRELLNEALKPCPTPSHTDCIPLAYLPHYAPGDWVTDEMIDNTSYRPLVPSTQLHDRLLRCILDRLEFQSLTRVKDIGWMHNQEYSHHDFVRFFTGESTSDPAFSVCFDAPVRTDCLTPRSFQALIMRHKPGGGGVLEVPPTLVWPSQDRETVYLQIRRRYVEQELVGNGFDVYLSLRCNFILDDQGRAVDGDLMARLQDGHCVVSPPTGSGIAGGTLESWISVRR